MARPLRIEFAGALYHVTSRGDGREAIYVQDQDRHVWLEVLGHVWERFNGVVHAYCQMGNHYHLLVETPEGNLAKGMRQLNGVYTQRFNQAHARVGHVSSEHAFPAKFGSADRSAAPPCIRGGNVTASAPHHRDCKIF